MSASEQAKRTAIKQSAQDFEASFLTSALGSMFEGVTVSEPFGGGEGEQAFKSFLNEAMAKQIVKKGGVGVAASVQREMLKMQGLTAEPQASAPNASAPQTPAPTPSSESNEPSGDPAPRRTRQTKLIVLTERLTGLIAAQAKAFEARRPQDAAVNMEETSRLANAYRHEALRIRANEADRRC